MEEPKVYIKKLKPNAMIPTRNTPNAAGLDLYSAESTVIPSRGRATVSTGIAISVPSGHYARIAPRSGLAANNGIDTGAGVVDSDYRGEVIVLLFNFENTDFIVSEGMRIAQLIIEKIAILPVEEVYTLDNTERGAKGFGSSGIN
jgi:dUTP pyrophosphatase